RSDQEQVLRLHRAHHRRNAVQRQHHARGRVRVEDRDAPALRRRLRGDGGRGRRGVRRVARRDVCEVRGRGTGRVQGPGATAVRALPHRGAGRRRVQGRRRAGGVLRHLRRSAVVRQRHHDREARAERQRPGRVSGPVGRDFSPRRQRGGLVHTGRQADEQEPVEGSGDLLHGGARQLLRALLARTRARRKSLRISLRRRRQLLDVHLAREPAVLARRGGVVTPARARGITSAPFARVLTLFGAATLAAGGCSPAPGTSGAAGADGGATAGGGGGAGSGGASGSGGGGAGSGGASGGGGGSSAGGSAGGLGPFTGLDAGTVSHGGTVTFQ